MTMQSDTTGYEDAEELGAVTSKYHAVWKRFLDGEPRDGYMSGRTVAHLNNFTDWVLCDFVGADLRLDSACPMSSRPRVAALLRMTKDCRYDSLSRSLSPVEAAMILHRCTLMQCMAEFTGTLRGIAYGVALAGRYRASINFVSRVLHAMHEHDSFFVDRMYADEVGYVPSYNSQRPRGDNMTWNINSGVMTSWFFTSASSQSLCRMTDDKTEVARLIRNGGYVRPKKTEVREIIKAFMPTALHLLKSKDDIDVHDHTPVTEVEVRNTTQPRQLVPAMSWAKLRAMAPVWRFKYGSVLSRGSTILAAEQLAERLFSFRRLFILRCVDAGYDASAAASVFSRVIECGMLLTPSGALVMQQDIHPAGSGQSMHSSLVDYREAMSSTHWCGHWLETLRDEIYQTVSDGYLHCVNARDYTGCHKMADACKFTDKELIDSGLLLLLPVSPSYVARGPKLLSQFAQGGTDAT